MPLRSIRAVTRPIRHSETDACPGALRLHAAADGPLARVRLPGGMLTGAQLAELGATAAEWGDGGLELTSRANVQLRALNGTGPAALAARLHAAGLLPSQTHEVVRNIAAPPLAGALVRDLVRTLDRDLCADPALAALPGRFLFAIGEVPLHADLAALPATPTASPPRRPAGEFTILLAGRDEGLRVPAARVVAALLAGAHAFLDERAAGGAPAGPSRRDPRQTQTQKPAWRLAELPDGPRRVAARVATALGVPLHHEPSPAATPHVAEGPDQPPAPNRTKSPNQQPTPNHTESPTGQPTPNHTKGPDQQPAPNRTESPAGQPVLVGGGRPPVVTARSVALAGVVEQPDGRVAVSAIVPLGRLTGVQVKVLADADRLVLTPERGVVVPDLTPEAAGGWLAALTEAGLPVEADSRWSGVTACAGRPGCAKSLADVRADALAATRFVDGLPAHWVGCARGCGSPSGPHVRVEATPDGYTVTLRNDSPHRATPTPTRSSPSTPATSGPSPATLEPPAPGPSTPATPASGPSTPEPSALDPSTPEPSALDPATPEPPALGPSTSAIPAPGPATPEPPALDRSTPEPPAPDPSTPEPPAPEPPALGPSTPEPPALGPSTSAILAPDPATLEPPAPGPSTPATPALGPSTPEPSALDPSTPEPSAPGPATPEPPALGPSTSAIPTPDPATPEPPAPGPATPEPSALDPATPELVPGPSTPAIPGPGSSARSRRHLASLLFDKSDKSDLDGDTPRPAELAGPSAATPSYLVTDHLGLAEIVAAARSHLAAGRPHHAEIVAAARRS